MDPVILSLISGGAGTVLGFALSEVASFVRERSRKREQANSSRLLVGIEIIDNSTQLRLFVETLEALSSQDRRTVALYLNDAAHYYTPTWQRVRWDTVSPIGFSSKELYNISFWYHQLESLLEAHRYILSQSALGRQLVEKHPALREGHIDFIVEKLAKLEEGTLNILKAGPPFTDKRLEQVNEEARKRWEALKQGQEVKPAASESSPAAAIPPRQ